MNTFRIASISFFALSAVACLPPAALNAPATPDGDEARAPAAPAAPRDPRIQALATKAAACKVEDEHFDDECEAFKAWQDAEDEFADDRGDATLLAMYEDPDPKMRLLATHKSISSGFLAQSANLARFRAVFAKEKLVPVRSEQARLFARLSASQPEVVATWKQMSEDPASEVRHSFGFHLSQPNPEALAISRKLANDPDEHVREGALSGLGMATSFGKNEPACQALIELLGREDDVRGHVQWTASATSCASVPGPLLASLLARTADPEKLDRGVIRYSLALDNLCDSTIATADQKRKAFEAARRLVDAKVKSNRWSGVKALAKCDPAQGKTLLVKLTSDQDKWVAREAKEALAKLAAKGKAAPAPKK